VYRPPNTDISLFNTELLSILNSIEQGKKFSAAFIAGDFNLNLLNANNHAATNDFVNNMLSFNFVATISRPTRIANNSATLLDNIFVNCGKYDYTSAIVYADISDHLPVAVHLKFNLKRKNQDLSQKRFFDASSIANFNNQLANTCWFEVHAAASANADPSIAYDKFLNIYVSIFDKYFPQKHIKLSNRMTPRNPWMTKGLMKACTKKSQLYRKYCKSKTKANEQKYKKYRNKLKSLLWLAEQGYYKEKLTIISGNIRETWKLLGSIFNKNANYEMAQFFTLNNEEITDKKDIVEKFNEYFVSIGSKLASLIPNASCTYSDYLKSPIVDSFVLYDTNSVEVINIVSDFKNKWSAGVDTIPVNIVKASIINIAEPIACLINKSFHSGIFPDNLKVAKVCPIHKTGEKSLFSNYRPISVLPTFSKIFEKAVSFRLMSFLEKNSILLKNQYGFRKNHSTYMAIIDMYDKISRAIDDGEYAVGVFIDLSKAFDTLNHEVLLSKLEYYGVRGTALVWFRNYLFNRQQYVFFKGESSSVRSIVCGVPQGSVLGPLLFILYINDIINCSNILKFILFADDTNLFYSNKNITELAKIMNFELAKVSTWFRANKLSLNASKTTFICFGSKHLPRQNSPLELFLDGSVLMRTDNVKFLGVYLDEKLNWNIHLNHISNKISRGLGIMGRCRSIFPNNILQTLYYSLVYPYLIYCCIVWGGACATALNKLQVLQNRCVRLITRSPYRSSASPLFKQLRILKLMDIRKLQIALFMFKCLNALLPDSCSQYCIINLRTYYNMRNNHDFLIPNYRTYIREQCISVMGPKVWDSLPQSIRIAERVDLLKRIVINYFISFYI
jgi:hypothetical protein